MGKIVEHRGRFGTLPSQIRRGDDISAEIVGIPLAATGETADEARSALEERIGSNPGVRSVFAPPDATIVIRWPDGRVSTLAPVAV